MELLRGMQQLHRHVRQPQKLMKSENAERGSSLEGPRTKPRREEPESLDRTHEKKSSTGTSIYDLPDEVLQLILQKALSIPKKDDSGMLEGLYRGVSNRWRKAVNGCAKAVFLRAPEGDVEGVLSALQSFTRVNRVRLVENEDWGGSSIGQLLQGMSTGLPSLKCLRFSIRCSGWEALSGLVYFLSHRTTLEELRLLFYSLDREGQPAVGQVLKDRARALLEDVDFSNLAHLRTFCLSYNDSMFCEGQGCLPLSKSILGLPRLITLYLELPGMALVHQLPPWLEGLGARVCLRLLDKAADKGLPCEVQYSESMRSLQRLRIGTFHKALDRSASDTVARLLSLTSLDVVVQSVGEDTSEHGIFSPSLKRLLVYCGNVLAMKKPMPLLEDLTLNIPSQTDFQRDLFAFTPQLRSLKLELHHAKYWPDFGRLPWQLTSLTVLTRCAVDTGPTVHLDVGRLQALQTLRLSCALLKRVAGAARLPASTAVTVHCGCFVRTTRIFVYQSECRQFESYAQYAGAGRRCRFLHLGPARLLFSDSRSQLEVDNVLVEQGGSQITEARSALPHGEERRERQLPLGDDLVGPVDSTVAHAGSAVPNDEEGQEVESKPQHSLTSQHTMINGAVPLPRC